MKNATFHVEVLKAQGVSPTLACHIVGMVDELERENARLREALKDAARRFRDPQYGCVWEDAAEAIDSALLPNSKVQGHGGNAVQ